MRCASCGSENPEGMKFCGECATPLKRRCPQCGVENPPTFKFCGECATPLAGQPARSQSSAASLQPLAPTRAEAERRQLTVMFIDLVGSTTLSQQLDAEDYHARVVAYQTACHQVIARYEGYIAQYLGDGVLVYFGYPTAHEDDAVRAVRSGLEIVTAVNQLPFTPPLQVRIGIHTGPVMVGEIGAGERTERLALGETPNIAARVQGVAEPDAMVVSAATYRLVQGLFECQALGPQTLKGLSTPLALYRVIRESAMQSRFEVAVQKGLLPLVGREAELGVLQRHWAQATDGAGQVVLLSGEPGIGKSRLVQEFKEQLGRDGVTRLEFRCSPYHQNSALYPIIDHLQRLLQFRREETPGEKLRELEDRLKSRGGSETRPYRARQEEVPLFAALLSLPHPEGYPPLTLSPQKQKQRTQEALVAWLIEEAQQAAVYCAWEDVHWADPSTLEFLTLFLEQIPTSQVFALLTFRPEFTPPWSPRSYLTQLTLNRLDRGHVEAMVENVTGDRSLPVEVLQQIVSKTDGVPLFVEELTKSVIEAVGVRGHAPLQALGIPSTLQDALMARLDRLGTAKTIAQLGATLGREFSYELLQSVSPVDATALQHALQQLIDAELLYQHGLLPHATYLFKHALIQDTAYQSLLKSRRQQYHRQIAQVLEARFAETKDTQPELLAHHYTEAGLAEQAIPYWQKAGERATQRSAHVEAISHFTKGLEVLKVLPETPERIQQELTLQLALGAALYPVKGHGAPEVEQTYTQARELCQQLDDTAQLVPVLGRLVLVYQSRAELQTAREIAEQMLHLAQSIQDPYFLSLAHARLGFTLHMLGEFTSARTHLEQGIALYDPQMHPHISLGLTNPRLDCLFFASMSLWFLGYPAQALQRSNEAVALVEGMSYPFSLAGTLAWAAILHLLRREEKLARERAEAVIILATEQGFPFWLAYGKIVRGWALAEQGQVQEGIAQMRQIFSPLLVPYVLAEAYGKTGQVEEGLSVTAEMLAFVNKTEARLHEAELYRVKGTLTLQSKVQGPKPVLSLVEGSKVQEAEECFLKAIDIARKQQAKSLELRATMSLVRLRQQQVLDHGLRITDDATRTTHHEACHKLNEAHEMLAEINGWFTEGFDTKDLQEAKALLDELSERG